MAAADPPTEAPPLLTGEQRRILRLSVAAMAVMSTGSMLGVASSLYLVNHYPLLLVALAPLGRHVWLVAPIVDPAAFVAVVVTRRMFFYTASFHLGRSLGPNGIPWIERRAAWFGRFVRWLERLFARASRTVVFTMAGPTVSALAGTSPMRGRVFAIWAFTGLVVRLLIVIGVATWLRPYIEVVLAWIDRYWIPGTVVMVVLVAIYAWRRRGRVPSFGT